MRRSLRILLASGVLVTATSGLILVAAPIAEADSVQEQASKEAWYAPLPTCALPIGCGPMESLPMDPRFQTGTLHVGVTAGFEDARSYLKFDGSALPFGVDPAAATLNIPLAGTDQGTVAPETASVRVCVATEPFDDVEGSRAPPPAVDCAKQALATYIPGSPGRLSVQLGALLSQGGTELALALLPGADVPPAATWHVAFIKSTAEVTWTYEPTSAPGDLDLPDAGAAPLIAPPPQLGPPPAIPPSAPPLVAPSRPAVVVAGGVSVPGFAYPIVFALPIALIALGGFIGRTVTRPIVIEQ